MERALITCVKANSVVLARVKSNNRDYIALWHLKHSKRDFVSAAARLTDGGQ